MPVTLRQEIWFDQGRDLKKTVSTLNGTFYEQLLETPQAAPPLTVPSTPVPGSRRTPSKRPKRA